MELDYFTLYLRNYLREHRFEEEDLYKEIIEDNAEFALATYISERNAGNSDIGATELALVDLFIGIGLSRLEAASDILEENFGERIKIDEPMVLDFWSQKLAEDETIWESFHIEGELGLNEESVEKGKGILITRIDQFLTNHGL